VKAWKTNTTLNRGGGCFREWNRRENKKWWQKNLKGVVEMNGFRRRMVNVVKPRGSRGKPGVSGVNQLLLAVTFRATALISVACQAAEDQGISGVLPSSLRNRLLRKNQTALVSNPVYGTLIWFLSGALLSRPSRPWGVWVVSFLLLRVPCHIVDRGIG